MQADIHPAYTPITIKCSCGNSFETKSTLSQDILNLDVCNKCHPFYTGAQRIVDTAGRVDRFKQKFNLGKNTDLNI